MTKESLARLRLAKEEAAKKRERIAKASGPMRFGAGIIKDAQELVRYHRDELTQYAEEARENPKSEKAISICYALLAAGKKRVDEGDFTFARGTYQVLFRALDTFEGVKNSLTPEQRNKYGDIYSHFSKALKEVNRLDEDSSTNTEAYRDSIRYKNLAQELRGEKNHRTKRGGLEKTASATTAIIGLIGGLFFLSSNITGNVIGLNQSTGNILGAVLLVVGLVGSFFWFRSRKR